MFWLIYSGKSLHIGLYCNWYGSHTLYRYLIVAFDKIHWRIPVFVANRWFTRNISDSVIYEPWRTPFRPKRSREVHGLSKALYLSKLLSITKRSPNIWRKRHAYKDLIWSARHSQLRSCWPFAEVYVTTHSHVWNKSFYLQIWMRIWVLRLHK